MQRQIMVLCACAAFRVEINIEMQRAGKKCRWGQPLALRFKKHKKLKPK
jgi:hypothetical protein